MKEADRHTDIPSWRTGVVDPQRSCRSWHLHGVSHQPHMTACRDAVTSTLVPTAATKTNGETTAGTFACTHSVVVAHTRAHAAHRHAAEQYPMGFETHTYYTYAESPHLPLCT